MALHPRGNENSVNALSLSNSMDDSIHLNIASKNSRGYDDQQDTFFADISSLSSSLMAKDGAGDSGDRPLPRSNSQLLSSNSYESLLHVSRGMEGSSSLLSGVNGYSKGLGGGQIGIGMSLEMPSPLTTLKQLSHGPGSGSQGSTSGTGLSSMVQASEMSVEDAEEEVALLAAQQESAQFPSEFIDKLVAVLKRCGADGLLGSQFPEAFKKLHGEMLVLENKKGKQCIL